MEGGTVAYAPGAAGPAADSQQILSFHNGAEMFDAEKLLGKIVHEVTGSHHGLKKKKKKKYKKTPFVDNLKSGAGLMTAIGLGIGAYEILKSKSAQSAGHPNSSGMGHAATPPPPPRPAGRTTPPPPPPPTQGAAVHSQPSVASLIDSQELAIRMLQAMIAAAHADGTMDEKEEAAVLDRLKNADLSQEERMFLFAELHAPKSIDELTAGITDPATAKAIYLLAVSTIEIDTPEERGWLDQFALQLGLSKAVQAFIEEQC